MNKLITITLIEKKLSNQTTGELTKFAKDIIRLNKNSREYDTERSGIYYGSFGMLIIENIPKDGMYYIYAHDQGVSNLGGAESRTFITGKHRTVDVMEFLDNIMKFKTL